MGVGLLFLGLAAAPGTAMAASPVVSTGAPSGVTETDATFNGTVNPGGETTQYGFYFADAGSEWCTSGGTSGVYSGGGGPLGFTDSTSHPVSQDHPGLTPGQSICYEVYASNASGTAVGSQVSFTTPKPLPPVVSTGAASAITGTSFTLNGTVNPQGRSTNYMFQYGFASSQWCQSGGATTGGYSDSPFTALGFNDSTAHAVSATVSGVNPGTSFCFRVYASNASGSVVGDFATFTTTDLVVRTDSATSIIGGGATLNGTINPQGSQRPSYSFDYAPSSSAFCTSGGTSNADLNNSGLQTFAFTDSSDHPVSAAVDQLTPGTTYCYRLVSRDQQFTARYGSLATFTTDPPVTLSVNVTGAGIVRDDGRLDIACAGTGPGAGPYGKCTADVVKGDVVTLRASTYLEDSDEKSAGNGRVAQRSQFAGWSGACSGTDRTCTVTMSGDKTVGAKFTSDSSPDQALAAALTPSGPAASIAALLKAGSYPAAFEAPGAGTAQIAWYQGSPSARLASAQKSLLVAKGAKTFTKAGKATIKIKLTPKGKALLAKVKKGQKLALTAKASFAPKGGKKTSKQKSFTLKG
jgi:hypothetical protein